MKHIALKPEDPEPYYWIGVIDWTLTYRSNLEMRGKWRLAHLTAKTLKDDDPMPPDVREDYIKENGQLIDEGITNLRKAIELRPDYDDAMAYLNLLLRRKADEAATPDERASLLKQADDLVDKAKEIKQKKMETRPSPNGRSGFPIPRLNTSGGLSQAACRFLGLPGWH